MERLGCTILEAGANGLVVARELSLAGRNVVIVKVENQIGTGFISPNSKAIQAGLDNVPSNLNAHQYVESTPPPSPTVKSTQWQDPPQPQCTFRT
jgi:hypothetical protein